MKVIMNEFYINQNLCILIFLAVIVFLIIVISGILAIKEIKGNVKITK